MNCTTFTYYVTLMAKRTCMCLIASSVKIITKRVLRCTDSSQPGWFHIETYMHVRNKPIQLVLSSEYDNYNRLEDHFVMYRFTSQSTKYVTFYA